MFHNVGRRLMIWWGRILAWEHQRTKRKQWAKEMHQDD